MTWKSYSQINALSNHFALKTIHRLLKNANVELFKNGKSIYMSVKRDAWITCLKRIQILGYPELVWDSKYFVSSVLRVISRYQHGLWRWKRDRYNYFYFGSDQAVRYPLYTLFKVNSSINMPEMKAPRLDVTMHAGRYRGFKYHVTTRHPSSAC